MNPAAGAEAQRQQHRDHDRRQDQRRAIVGEQRRHRRAQQHQQHEQLAPAAPAPARHVQRGPLEEAGLIQHQADDDHRDEGKRRVPDNAPDGGDVRQCHHASQQRQRSAERRAPAHPQSPGLPDDQHDRDNEDQQRKQHAQAPLARVPFGTGRGAGRQRLSSPAQQLCVRKSMSPFIAAKSAR